MEYLHSLFDTTISEPTAITVGKFDGIHKGHSILTKKTIQKNSDGLKSCIITFMNSPRIALEKDQTPSLITNDERKFILESAGLNYLVECPFDERMMKTSAEDFIKYLSCNLNMKYMTVGEDFHFGYMGKGDVNLLKELSEKFSFELEVIEKIKRDHRDISSTYIREELALGHIDTVNEMLGYEYFVWGEVVHGAHLGHKIGIPTINILPPTEKLVPKFGVYATSVEVEGRLYHGVTNVGMKPTVTDEGILGIETNILDYTGDLYGRMLKVTFKKFLRPEMKFSSVEELQKQMNADKIVAKKLFNS